MPRKPIINFSRVGGKVARMATDPKSPIANTFEGACNWLRYRERGSLDRRNSNVLLAGICCQRIPALPTDNRLDKMGEATLAQHK